MYFAVKYARKKYKERQAAKLAGPSAQDPSSAEAQVQFQPGVEQPSEQHVEPTVEAGEAGKAAAPAELPIAPVAAQTDIAVPELAVTSGKAAKTVVSDEEKIQKKKRRQYRVKIIFGLVAPFALQALDTTIIASALPYIAKDFSTSTKSQHGKLTHLRPDRPAQLDHLRLQPHLRGVSPFLGADRRRVWTEHDAANDHLHHARRQRHLHRRPD
jgi:hypothetical protein